MNDLLRINTQWFTVSWLRNDQ